MKNRLIGAVLFPTENYISRLRDIQCGLPLVRAYSSGELHITLGLGVLPIAGLEEAYEDLKKITISFLPITLQCTGIKYHDGMFGLLIEKSDRLLGLHAMVMNMIFKSLRYHKITTDMFCRDAMHDPIEEGTLSWAQTFRSSHSFASFNPHITLGTGLEQEILWNSNITIGPINSLALCHMGNHGIPRKVLFTERSKS